MIIRLLYSQTIAICVTISSFHVKQLTIFYDVQKETVEVLAVVPKSRAGEWLTDVGEQ
jgi:hypothetical protein